MMEVRARTQVSQLGICGKHWDSGTGSEILKSDIQNFINWSITGGQGYTYTTSIPLSVHN